MTAVPQPPPMQITNIAIDSLVVDRCNPRTDLDVKKVEELAKQLRARGVIEPLIVRPVLTDNAKSGAGLKYSVLCGSRRLAAGKKADLDTLPCIVRSPENDAEAREIAITEQDSSVTLHYLERAAAYRQWADDGATHAEIAEKTHHSKSAVSMIIALNDLTPEVKRACHEGKLYEDTARAIASMPPSTHAAILKKCLEPNGEGKPKNTREMREAVASFRLDLTKAPFDPEDKTLHCSVFQGSCMDCPRRSGSQPELFSDTKNEMLCTAPDGYANKSEIAWLRIVEEGRSGKGSECLLPKQTDSYFDPAGNLKEDAPYVMTSAICHEDVPQRTYGELVPKTKESFVLARQPKTGHAVRLISKARLAALMEESGKLRRAPRPQSAPASKLDEAKLSAEARKQREEKVKRRQLAIRRLIGMVNAKLARRDPDKKWWRLVADSLIAQGVVRLTLKRRDVQEDPKKFLDRLSEGDLRQFVFEGALEHELFGDQGSDKWPHRLVEAAKLAGVDPVEAEREVVAEERAQPKVVKPTKPVKAEATPKKGAKK